MHRAVGIVLAAGAGRRMGMPKALLRDSDGVPLLDRAVAALRDGGCEHVVVVLGARADEVSWPRADGVSVVVAHDWADGMGASLRAGLAACERLARPHGGPPSLPGDAHGHAGTQNIRGEAVSSDPDEAADRVVIMLVDLPDVDARLVARLLDVTDADGTRALGRATFDGRPGHPVIIGRDHWADASVGAHGDRGARDLFSTRRHRLIDCTDLATGRDVDTPDDLDTFVEGPTSTPGKVTSGEVASGVAAADSVTWSVSTNNTHQETRHA